MPLLPPRTLPRPGSRADRFHILKNLTEAVQVCLSRCQAGSWLLRTQKQLRMRRGVNHSSPSKQWRPPSQLMSRGCVARRAGRYARYQHVVELEKQGMSTQEIAGRVGMSDRTIRDWLNRGAFPEARRRRVAGRVLLMPLLLTCSNEGLAGSAMASASSRKSSSKGIPEQSAVSIVT